MFKIILSICLSVISSDSCVVFRGEPKWKTIEECNLEVFKIQNDSKPFVRDFPDIVFLAYCTDGGKKV